MLDKKGKHYIKTPTFYYIYHLANYVKPGAKRIHFNKFFENISVSPFQNPDKSVIIVLLNKTNENIEYNLCYQDTTFRDHIENHSIITYVIT